MDIDQAHLYETTGLRELLTQLSGLSVYHAVQGLVYSKLARTEVGSKLFLDHRDEIQHTLALVTRQATLWDFEQDRVLMSLDRAGFDPLVLKGGALRRWVFGSPVERAMGDLDILVDKAEVPAVLEALRGLNYESEYSDSAREAFQAHLYHDRVTHPNGFHVEVHWDLTRPDASVRLDSSLFQNRSVELSGERGTDLRVPSLEDMVLHTASQSMQDGVRKLRRIVDLDRILSASDLDWTYITSEARRIGLYPSLCVSLRLAQLLLGSAPPEEISQGLFLSNWTRKGIAAMRPPERMVREPSFASVPDFYLYQLWCTPPGKARWSFFIGTLSGSRDPLRWIWEEEDEPGTTVPSGNILRGVLSGIKIVIHQVSLLISACLTLLRRGGRQRLRFWMPGP